MHRITVTHTTHTCTPYTLPALSSPLSSTPSPALSQSLTPLLLCCVVLLCRFGEVVDCHLVRDKDSGKSRGFAFLAYEDQRSCVLAIDNLNGASVVHRTLRVDHADKYRRPKESTPTPSSTSEELQFDGDAAPDYDERRKAIWDYQAYGPPPRVQGQGGSAGLGVRGNVREGGGGGGGGGGAAPTSYSVDVKGLKVGGTSEDQNALRILKLWEERQSRKQQREEEERRREEQHKKGRGYGGGGQTFGVQTVTPMQGKEGKGEERKEAEQRPSAAAVKGEERGDDRGGKSGDVDRDSRDSKSGRGDERAEAEAYDRRKRRRSDSRDRSPSRRRSDSRERDREDRHKGRRRDRDADDRRHRSRDRDTRHR